MKWLKEEPRETKADRLCRLLHAPYFLHKDPAIAEEFICEFRNAGDNMGRSSIPLFMLVAHPEQAEEWQRKYNFYLKRCARYIEQAGSDHVGWNDYFMSKWFITGEEECFAKLVVQTNRTSIWAPPGHSPRPGCGSVGEYARWMISSVASQCPEFRRRFDEFLTQRNMPIIPRHPLPRPGR